jgi:hypothetical protein
MSSGRYSEMIRDALFQVEASESVERVKDAVSSVFRESDPQVKVHRTHYFNHTFSPDLILEWPGQSRETPRKVFLRATQQPSVVAEDIGLVGDLNPIILHLDEFSENTSGSRPVTRMSPADTEILREKALETRSLVTGVGSLEEFNSVKSNSAGAGLFSSSLVRGGLGLLEQESADEMAHIVAQGFRGAQAVDLESTVAVLGVIEEVLDTQESRRMASVLQAVWVGSGGHAYDFPSVSRELTPRLDADALRFLLDAEDLDDEEFWNRLGRSVELKTLTALGSIEETPALQKLLNAALPLLRAKSCLVRRGRGRLDSKDLDFRWSIDRHALTLRGHSVQAWLADRLEDVEVPTADTDLPGIATVRKRAQLSTTKIFEFEATNGVETLRFGSEAESGVIDRDDAFVTEALGEAAGVRRATTVLRTGHNFDINFVGSSASGRTRAKPTVSDVVWTSLNLLADLDTDARTDLERVVARLELPDDDSSDAEHQSPT